jgi:hypothetical protein
LGTGSCIPSVCPDFSHNRATNDLILWRFGLAHGLPLLCLGRKEDLFMDRKIKTVVLGSFLAGVLMTPASGLARDYWHWSKDNSRWDRRADLRSDQRDLEEARRQLEFDRRHHASRRKLAEDEARIRDIERDIRVDRQAHR